MSRLGNLHTDVTTRCSPPPLPTPLGSNIYEPKVPLPATSSSYFGPCAANGLLVPRYCTVHVSLGGASVARRHTVALYIAKSFCSFTLSEFYGNLVSNICRVNTSLLQKPSCPHLCRLNQISFLLWDHATCRPWEKLMMHGNLGLRLTPKLGTILEIRERYRVPGVGGRKN